MSNLKTLLSNTAAFQTWVDADDAAEAATSIIYVAEDEDNVSRPFALLMMDTPWTHDAVSSGPDFRDRGSLAIRFEGTITEAYVGTPADEFFEFTNSMGAIISGMADLSRNGSYMHVTQFSVLEPVYRSTRARAPQHGDYMGMVLGVKY